MKNIEQLIEKIKINDKVIYNKTNEFVNFKIKQVSNILNLSFKYLTFTTIENLELTHFNVEYGSLIFFQNLCQHAILLDTLHDSDKLMPTSNSDDKYELWLLWNKEFCVTRLNTIYSKDYNDNINVREVIDYGDCAFKTYNGNFIWNMDNIIENIESNLQTTLDCKETIRQLVEGELKKINIKN